jgi:hypothetical protein
MINKQETDLSVDPSIDLCPSQKNKKITPFTAQGFIDNCYYFYVRKINRVVAIKSNQFKQRYLLKLARIDYWRENFGTRDKRKPSGVNWNDAEIELMTACYDKGEFKGAVVRTRAIRKYSDDISIAKNVEGA